MQLFFAPGSSSMAPHIALHEIGVPFEPATISLAANQQNSAEFLKLNPLGKVPVLLVDGQILTEVAAILYFLARKHPQAGLFPNDDITQAAQCVSWMSYIASTLHPARGQGDAVAREIYALADGKLGPRQWVLDEYSIADIHLFRLYWRLRGSMHPDPSEFPNLEAHYQRMMQRPAVQKTIEVESAIGYELPG